jgi:hypothetical protein
MVRIGALAVAALAVAALALLLAGCGTVQAGAGVADHPAGSPSPAQWHTYVPGLGQIVSVRVGGTGRVLAVGDMMPTGRAGCERDLTGKVAEFAAKGVYLTITYQSRLAVVGPCSWRVVTVGVTLPAWLGQRDVMVNSEVSFEPRHGALMMQCEVYGCPPVTPPPPASCSPSSYGQAMGATGPPMDAAYGVLGCDGRWLALNVGWPGGAAGCDGPSCSLDMVSTYWFFRATPRGWDPIAASRAAGCARVHKAEPQFPARLCAALPALPG